MSGTNERTQLRRLRWLVVAGLALGIAGTTAANVLHAQDSVPARIISAWAPLTLFFVLEVITRAPTPARWWLRLTVRLGATVLGSGAAVVSYRHMVAVALRYGEDQTASHLLPIFVDGLVVVMSAYLVDISARIRDLEAARAAPLPATATETGQPAQNLPASPAALPTAGQDAPETVEPGPWGAPPTTPADDTDSEELPDPEPLLPGIRRLTGHLPTPPGRVIVQRAARELGESIGSTRADRIKDVLAAEPWPPAQTPAHPAFAGQSA